jgi:hypothetical protein
MDRTCLPANGFVILLAGLAAVCGCGPKSPSTIPVSGTVTLNGAPVAGAAVMFMPRFEGRPALAVTDETGRFTLTTFHTGDGAMPGEHAVTVTLNKVTGFLADKDGLSAGIAPEGIREEWIVPQRYSSPETSNLSVDVREGVSPVTLDLQSP